jgi:hypothetical protein
MRRGLKIGQTRPVMGTNHMGKEMDWLLDQWNESSQDVKLQLVLAKIRAEEKSTKEGQRAV